MATEDPRLVLIRTSQKSLGFNSPTPIPAALHVCSESREVALKIYDLRFGSRTDGFDPKIFFNFDQDTAYFRGDRDGNPNIGVFGTEIKLEERDRIQYLAIDINTGSPDVACRYVNLQQWNGLKNLSLCIEEPRLDLESDLKLRGLKEKDQWGFVRDYRGKVNYALVPRTIRPLGAVKRIEERHLNSHSVLKEILNKNNSRGVSLAVVGTE